MHPAEVFFFSFSHPVKRAWTVRLGSLTACRTKSPEFCRSCRAGTGCEVAPLARRSAVIFSAHFDMPHHMRYALSVAFPKSPSIDGSLDRPPPPLAPGGLGKYGLNFVRTLQSAFQSGHLMLLLLMSCATCDMRVRSKRA